MLNFSKLLGRVYNEVNKFFKQHGLEFLKLSGMMGIFFRWHHDIYAGFSAE